MMHYLPSSILDLLDKEEIEKFNNYLGHLTVNEAETILISKIHDATDIEYSKIALVLKKCTELGIFNCSFAIRCPECGRLIKQLDYLDESEIEKIDYCYICEEDIKLSEKDIIMIFSLNINTVPFDFGQDRCDIKQIVGAAQEYDTLSYNKGIFTELRRFNDREEQKQKEAAINKERNEMIEEVAYKRYKINYVLKIVLNISLCVLLAVIIYHIVLNCDETIVAAIFSGFTYMFSFIFSNVIDRFCNTNLDMLKLEVKRKMNL